jgi:hypothetical protein
MYFRITAYHRGENLSGIFDSNGMFGELSAFRFYLDDKGFEIVAASTAGQFLDGNIEKVEPIPDKIILRACMSGRPKSTAYEIDGVTYPAIQVKDKIYIPEVPEKKESVSWANDKDNTGSRLKNYRKVKDENPGAIVFYRVGDFYEILSTDAGTVSAILGLTLVSRDFDGERVPMCGVPHHSLDSYVQKLTDFGFKVAIAEPTD